jgi:hypothetical protein
MKSLATTTVARLNPAVSGLPAPHNQILVPIVTTHTAHHTTCPPSSFIVISV